jgi:hypothetical protein
MRDWHFKMMYRGGSPSQEQLQAIIDPEFILKQLICQEDMDDSLILHSKTIFT